MASNRKLAKLRPNWLFAHGVLLACFGCLQIGGAIQFHNNFGFAVGAASVAFGAALLLTATQLKLLDTSSNRSPSSSRTTTTSNSSSSAVLLPRWAAKAVTGLTAWLLLLVLVHIFSPDPNMAATGFPASCPPSKLLGCSRVAVSEPHRSAGLQPVELQTSLDDAAAAVLTWIQQQPRTQVLHNDASTAATAAAAATTTSSNRGSSSKVFMHARFVSLLWGFADDLFVQLSCQGNGKVLVEAQGQLRVGVGDMEVNVKRNVRLLEGLQELSLSGLLRKGSCKVAPVG